MSTGLLSFDAARIDDHQHDARISINRSFISSAIRECDGRGQIQMLRSVRAYLCQVDFVSLQVHSPKNVVGDTWALSRRPSSTGVSSGSMAAMGCRVGTGSTEVMIERA